jgi:hypothetical protein
VKCCGFVEFWRELGEKTQKKWKFAKKLVENAKFFLSSTDFPSLMYLDFLAKFGVEGKGGGDEL